MASGGLVSIVLPTHNGVTYLGESLDSCLVQSYRELEIIVVVDGSTDSTMDLLDQYTDSRITVVENKTNLGLPRSLNKGFSQSSGTYLTWTSDDNRYAPSAIAVLAAYLDGHDDADLVYSSYWEIDPEGRRIGLVEAPSPSVIMDYDPVGACFLYRRSVYAELGGYSPEHAMYEDYEYWLRASQRFGISAIAEPLYEYRLHPASLSSRKGLRHKRERDILRMKRARFGLSSGLCRKKMAEIDMDEAYEAFVLYGDRRRSWQCYATGIVRDPVGLANLGMVKVMVSTLLPGWSNRQQILLGRWAEGQPEKARWLLGLNVTQDA